MVKNISAAHLDFQIPSTPSVSGRERSQRYCIATIPASELPPDLPLNSKGSSLGIPRICSYQLDSGELVEGVPRVRPASQHPRSVVGISPWSLPLPSWRHAEEGSGLSIMCLSLCQSLCVCMRLYLFSAHKGGHIFNRPPVKSDPTSAEESTPSLQKKEFALWAVVVVGWSKDEAE